MDTLLQILHTSLSISIPSFLYRLVESVLSHSVRVWEEGSGGGGNLEGGRGEGEEMEDNGGCCDCAGSKCDMAFAVLLSVLYKHSSLWQQQEFELKHVSKLCTYLTQSQGGTHKPCDLEYAHHVYSVLRSECNFQIENM